MPGGWVLIVEDNAGLARTVAQVLRAVGVSAVECAESALALASRPAPVAALVDVGLPGGHGSGVDLAVVLRRQHPEADIVVWSGADDSALVHEAHAARFDFITKAPGVELPRDRARRWARLAREELNGSRAPAPVSTRITTYFLAAALAMACEPVLASGCTAASRGRRATTGFLGVLAVLVVGRRWRGPRRTTSSHGGAV